MARTSGVTPTSYVVRVTLTGGTAANVTWIRAWNSRTGEYVDVRASSNSAAVNLANMNDNNTFSGFENGDVIEFRAFGLRIGSATHTVDTTTKTSGGQVTVTVVDVDGTSNPEFSV